MIDVTSSIGYDWILWRAAKQQFTSLNDNTVIISPDDIITCGYFGLDANYRLGGTVRYASESSNVSSTVTVPLSVMIYYDDSYQAYCAEIKNAAEKDLFSSLSWDCLQIGEPVEAE